MLSLVLLLASAKSVAVVPIAGASVTSVELTELASVDDAVRSSVPHDFALQSKEQTSAALASARAAGVLCALSDEPCWKKAAALCDVELLLVPSAALRADGDVALVLTLVDATHDAQRTAGVVARKDDGRTKKLVDDVFARLDAPAPVDTDPPAPVEPAAAPAPTIAPAVAPTTKPADATLVVGGAVGAGALLGVIAAAVTSWIVIATPPRHHEP